MLGFKPFACLAQEYLPGLGLEAGGRHDVPGRPFDPSGRSSFDGHPHAPQPPPNQAPQPLGAPWAAQPPHAGLYGRPAGAAESAFVFAHMQPPPQPQPPLPLVAHPSDHLEQVRCYCVTCFLLVVIVRRPVRLPCMRLLGSDHCETEYGLLVLQKQSYTVHVPLCPHRLRWIPL